MPTAGRASQAQTNDELRALGEALLTRSREVVEQIVLRTQSAGADFDEAIRINFERIGEISTGVVARVMAGGDPNADLDASREAWEIFGQLAAHRAAPLNEITKRCLRWRDVINEMLGEIAAERGIRPGVVTKSRAIVQTALDVTLVHVCEVFESERARTGDELARRQEELAFMATHDPLTGLPNRTLLLDRAEQMLGRARRHGTPVAALYINLDNFTSINDTIGHDGGNELLQAIAQRLLGAVRETDTLGRIGGDEFVLLAEDLAPDTGAEMIAERLQAALTGPFTIAASRRSELTLSASIGIAIGERASAEELLRDADIAMHRARREGTGGYLVYETEMQNLLQSRMELEMGLRGALAGGEFFLVYQPTFDLRGMVPTGLEALLRWRRPGHEIVQPNDFIPLLEETGMIVQVGRWVLDRACRQASAWRAAGHDVGIAVNVSGRQLDTDDLIGDVERSLADAALDANALTLEITETTLMRNPEATALRLKQLRKLGVRVAIDDFGTGYSSLAHLQRFPVDSIKIDRSFVSQLGENPESETLIRTLVQLGKALSIETLAEGIEGERELRLLQEEKCDSGQGYLFARPLAVDDAEMFLRNSREEHPPLTLPLVG